MSIAIGTTNVVKIQAIEEVIQDYPLFANMSITGVSVPSGISEQPLSLEEMIAGAKNRAKNAFAAAAGSTYSFGIESGLFEAAGTQTGFLEATICCIHNGADDYIGLSCGFEVPPKILSLVLGDNKLDLSQACHHSGITSNAKLGAAEGLIGLLTKGRLNRKDYTKQSVVTALIQLENALWYGGADRS